MTVRNKNSINPETTQREIPTKFCKMECQCVNADLEKQRKLKSNWNQTACQGGWCKVGGGIDGSFCYRILGLAFQMQFCTRNREWKNVLSAREKEREHLEIQETESSTEQKWREEASAKSHTFNPWEQPVSMGQDGRFQRDGTKSKSAFDPIERMFFTLGQFVDEIFLNVRIRQKATRMKIWLSNFPKSALKTYITIAAYHQILI